MNTDDLSSLKKIILKLRSGKGQLPFVYFPNGDDGQPQLVIRKKLSSSAILKMRKAAQKKKMASGLVGINQDGVLEFRAKAAPPSTFIKHLKSLFGSSIPMLKRAVVTTGAPEEEDSSGLDLQTARHRQQVATTEAAQATQQMQNRRDAFEAGQLRVTEPAVRLRQAMTNQSRIEKAYDNRQRVAEQNLSDLQATWGIQQKKKKRLKAQTLLDEQDLMSIRMELYTAVTSRNASRADIKRGFEAFEQFDTELKNMYSAQAQVARCSADVAHAEAINAESELARAEDALSAALESNSGIQTLKATAESADRQAEAANTQALKLAARISKLEEQLEGASEGEKAEIQRSIEEAEAAFEEAMETAESLVEAAEEAQTSLQEATDALKDDAVIGPLLAAVAAKEDDLETASEAESEALLQYESAEEKVQNATRGNAIMEYAGSWMTQELFDSGLSKIKPGDSSIKVNFSQKAFYAYIEPTAFYQKYATFVTVFQGTPLTDTGQTRFPNVPGMRACTALGALTQYGLQQWTEGQQQVSERGREVAENFDWQSYDAEFPDTRVREIAESLSGLSQEAAIETLLGDNDLPGLVIGESHGQEAAGPEDFITDNMDTLKEQGVDTIYVEDLLVDWQHDIDLFLSSPANAPMPTGLQAVLSGISGTAPRLQQLLETAKEKGLRVRAMDTGVNKGQLQETLGGAERARRMNAFANDAIMEDPGRRGKFALLAGKKHNQAHVPESEEEAMVPGMHQLLGSVPILIGTDSEVSVDRTDAITLGREAIIPSLIGKTVEAATSTLVALGMEIGLPEEADPSSLITTQSVPENSQVAKGTRVTCAIEAP